MHNVFQYLGRFVNVPTTVVKVPKGTTELTRISDIAMYIIKILPFFNTLRLRMMCNVIPFPIIPMIICKILNPS